MIIMFTLSEEVRMKADIADALASGLPATLAPTTKRAYMHLLRQLWVQALGRNSNSLIGQNPKDWAVRDLDALIAWVMKSDRNPRTARNYITVLMIVCKGYEGYAYLQQEMNRLNALITDLEDEQCLDFKEEKYLLSHTELLSIVEAFRLRLEQLPAYKEKRPLTQEEAFGEWDGWNTLFEYLALCVMVQQPPVRGDWGCVRHEQDVTKPQQNHLARGPDGLGLFIKHDKVVNLYGPSRVMLNDAVESAIESSFVLWPRLFVFPARFDPGLSMGVIPFTKFLREIRHPVTLECMNQGVQLLRASYVTWMYDQQPTLTKKKYLANCMRHSQATAEKFYRKLK